MSSFKRKRVQLDESDEDEPAYGKQILPVANLPADFNDEPMDGMQYLFMVRRDARLLPGTVRVENPYEKPSPPVTEERFLESFAGPSQLPLESWRETFEYRFQNFRRNFNQPTIHVGAATPGPRGLMPDKKDRDMWWAFLSGQPESEWNPTKKAKNKSKRNPSALGSMCAWTEGNPQQDSSPSSPYNTSQQLDDEGEVEQVLKVSAAESLPSPAGTPVPLEYFEGLSQPSSTVSPPTSLLPEDKLTPREPTSILLKMIDERVALHLLMYFTHWINLYLKEPEPQQHLPTECHARWIFVLLSRIDDFISSDDLHLLRNLARACLALLGHIKKQQQTSSCKPPSKRMGENACWIIITTIAGVWKQRDLWMDAESILKKL
ncbi:hypothetical protein JR316_0004856 [Psilocybe cubensis]|uniref:Gem-associated protein 2 n=2 Tax=Psilocybe cubensis TaxID=181762 RepID=A0A8H7Y1L7_PSICU|nr:hypothetical protein JR316_0004856 [Psilocybe cubensis]KAH9482756.1 hypothetical protein JR316_0004856 [Psilocybe cubensis]